MAETAPDDDTNHQHRDDAKTSRRRRLVQAPVPPMDVDGLRVVVVGTAAWMLATAVLLLFRDGLVARGDAWWILVGFAGTGLGVCGVLVGLWRRHRRLRGRGRVRPRPGERLP